MDARAVQQTKIKFKCNKKGKMDKKFIKLICLETR